MLFAGGKRIVVAQPSPDPAPNPNPGGTDYFSWSCESDTTSLGSVVQYFGGSPVGSSSTRTTLAGDGVMRLVVVGNDSGNQQLGAEVGLNSLGFAIVGGAAVYYRWYMRIESGFSWGAGTAKTKSSRIGGGPVVNGSASTQGYTGYLMSNGFLIGECGSGGCTVPGGGINTDENHLISYDFTTKNDGVWREYVVMVKPNSGAVADGQFQAWVDNVSIGTANNFILHTAAGENHIEMWGGWMVQPYFQLNGTAQNGGTIYVRDFLVSNYYNSLLD